jgi:hypothetical protein
MLDKEKTITRIAPLSLTQIKNGAPPPVPLPTRLTVRCRSDWRFMHATARRVGAETALDHGRDIGI